jgi:hypothetical protein
VLHQKSGADTRDHPQRPLKHVQICLRAMLVASLVGVMKRSAGAVLLYLMMNWPALLKADLLVRDGLPSDKQKFLNEFQV